MIKVLLADDHQMFIDGVKSMLAEEDTLDFIGHCNTGQEVLNFLATNREVDVVVLDIEMPDMNGIETTKLIKKKYPHTKVLVLSMYNDTEFTLELLRLGTNGYILKNTTANTLVQAIHNVYNGKAHYGIEILNQFVQSPEDPDKTNFSSELSSREIDVLRLIAEGLTTKEISEKLHISEATVNTYRRNLLQKLEVPNDKHLVRYAIRHKLIEP